MGIVSKIKEALTRAQSSVDALQGKCAHWQGVVEAKRAELADLEAGVGERVFGDESGSALQEYAAARTDLSAAIEGAQAAKAVAERKLRAAQCELKAAQAAELRDQARTVRSRAEKLQAEIDELRIALEAKAGGSWRPWEPTAEDVLNAGAAGIAMPALKAPPLFAQADQLDRQAAQLEEQVATERRQAAPQVPTASVHWDGTHYRGRWRARVDVGVSGGIGSATLEIVKDGQVVEAVTLPDGPRLGTRKYVEAFLDELIEVRCNGEVLASCQADIPVAEDPAKAKPGEVVDGRGRGVYAPAFQ